MRKEKQIITKGKRRKKARYFGAMIDPRSFIPADQILIILVPLLIVTLLPLIFIISHAFKPLDELYAFPALYDADHLR